MATLKYEEVYQKYVIDGLSDNDIANEFHVGKTAVVHCRKRNNIPTREYLGSIGEGIVMNELQQSGFVAINMNMRSKIHPYDILVHGLVRIDVKTATPCEGRWKFQLSNPAITGNVESDHYVKLENGRMRKQFEKVCDFLIFCGINGNKHSLFVVPAAETTKNSQVISIGVLSGIKWQEWHNRFDLITNLINARRKD